MYAEERQQAIVDLVGQRGRVSVVDLADRFDVTTETVRRDLSVPGAAEPGPSGARRRGAGGHADRDGDRASRTATR